MKRLLFLFIILLAGAVFAGCSAPDMFTLEENKDEQETVQEGSEFEIEEAGYYTGRDEVALYIHTFNRLPDNFITKSEAGELGWEPSEGNLWEVTERKSIGGDRFGNREGLLPEKEGRQYYEADINYEGGYRGAERIVYSNDGLIYYTDDHYDTFTILYGDE
ncbi:ribonuclease domain-containing protein [Virgibacillus kimchii]